MKSIIIFILLSLFLASCSQSRYGHVPKVKRGETKQVYKAGTKRKIQSTEIAIKNSKSVVFVDSVKPETITVVKNETAPMAITQSKSEHKKISKTIQAANTEKNVSKNKVNTTKQTITANNTGGIFEDFWYSDLGDFIIQLGFIIVGVLFIAFLGWLVSIGWGWLVIIIVLALLIWLLIEISQLFDGVFDVIFRRK